MAELDDLTVRDMRDAGRGHLLPDAARVPDPPEWWEMVPVEDDGDES